ncbi:HD domain-containing protein [Aquimarina sp. 2201CG14-23]|uniref:HD domain-containing protein n=1 Tax=Aquimarina mycalae TaxID=3040073 RepID=UPI0024781E50|nr:hypothetical protein [Aquimarina sp. 2201CG14-23]MDH7447518.1 hypothetical protein [Aquimarina sp. 2201CG14-23]
MLRDIFIPLLSKYSEDPEYITSLWNGVYNNHHKKNRYYHNITHLENLYQNLLSIESDIKDWDITLFALFYHDYYYNILKKDNEERSAQKAVTVLDILSVSKQRIGLCKEMIMATKGHQISENNDINYFTDADLSILGSNWPDYKDYYKNVRKEYKYYPDFIYHKGRLQVLQHFIDMPRIFKTTYFYNKYEKQAKSNLLQEINLLSK